MTKPKHSNSQSVPVSRIGSIMAILTSRFFIPVFFCGAFLLSILILPSDTASTIKMAHAQEAIDDMVVNRIGLIDLDGVIRASKGTAKVRELLDKQRLLFQQEFSKREAALQQTERELISQRELLSEEVFAEKLSQFEIDVTKTQKEIQYRREAIDVAFQNAQAKLRLIALEIVKEVAGEKRLDLVLVKNSALIFRPTLNISDEVLQRLNERTKNARLEVTIDPPKPASQE